MTYNFRPKTSYGRKKPKRWCKTHPGSQWSDGYERCGAGNYNLRTRHIDEPCVDGSEPDMKFDNEYNDALSDLADAKERMGDAD